MGLSIDIELTNRCNANCHFCPRDMTPHQGLMSPEIYAQALRRAEEFRAGLPPEMAPTVGINLCGLGEPLLNKHAPAFVRQAREADFICGMSSNASLLDERRGTALVEAGLQRILINASDRDEEYEAVYELPFQKTYDNVVRFLDIAGDDCEVIIVLVDHRYDKAHLAEMRAFWEAAGIEKFVTYDVINRGGALFVDHMQYETYEETAQARDVLTVEGREPLCAAPFVSQFVGYDGQYYLCCSDWKKEAPLGSVFDESFESITAMKLRHLQTREPVCKTCNLDPVNRVTEELRAVKAGASTQETVDAIVHQVVTSSAVMHESLAAALAKAPHASTRKRIPVQVL